jgi:hypothetical protein
MQGIMSLSIGLLLVSSLATMAMVLNPAFAFAGTGFKNKAECMEYVLEGTYVVRNHALKNVKGTSRENVC